MQGTEQLIELYHAGFLICLILTIVFAFLSILIFFKFKIRQVFDLMTGRGEKRTIRQMEEENAKTGKLRQDVYIPTASEELPRTPSGNIPKVIMPVTEEMDIGTEITEKTYTPAADQIAEGSEETTLLADEEGYGETTVLGSKASDPVKKEGKQIPGKFEIIKENMWIHTKEII